MMKIRGKLWVVLLLGILAVGLTAGPELWAAPGQSLARQTVPTKTPTPEPTSPSQPATPKPTSQPPEEQPTPVPTAPALPSVPSSAAAGGQTSAPLLPAAGGWSIHLGLSIAMLTAGLLILIVVGRRA